MDHLDALQPFAPYDATVTLFGTITPAEAAATGEIDLSPARLDALATELHAVRLECLQLARRRHELAFAIVGHNEIAALNARLRTVQALNLTRRDYHRVSRVTAWPTPPIPAAMLMSPADLIPYLDAALSVLSPSAVGRESPLGLARTEQEESAAVGRESPLGLARTEPQRRHAARRVSS